MRTRIGLLLLICGGLACAQKPDEQSIRTAVDAYRRMWQAMSPDQRKTMVEAGGATPERYEQTMRMQLTGAAKSAAPNAARTSEGVVRTDLSDTLKTSSEDLNAVRDANLIRLRDEACPPEVALQVAALRSSISPAVMPSPAVLLAVADSWHKRAPDTAASTPRPIDELLGAAPMAAKPTDRASVNAEIERLLGSCKR